MRPIVSLISMAAMVALLGGCTAAQVKEAGSREIGDDVVSGRLELGLVTLPVLARELELSPLFEDEVVLAASLPQFLQLIRHEAAELEQVHGSVLGLV